MQDCLVNSNRNWKSCQMGIVLRDKNKKKKKFCVENSNARNQIYYVENNFFFCLALTNILKILKCCCIIIMFVCLFICLSLTFGYWWITEVQALKACNERRKNDKGKWERSKFVVCIWRLSYHLHGNVIPSNAHVGNNFV